MVAAYNSDLLVFDSFNSIDSDAIANCTEPGKILLSFVSSSNISADIELCSIKFKRISEDSESTALNIRIQDIAAWNDDATDYVDVKSEVMNEKSCFFEEVVPILPNHYNVKKGEK